jgi:hypothetical protein
MDTSEVCCNGRGRGTVLSKSWMLFVGGRAGGRLTVALHTDSHMLYARRLQKICIRRSSRGVSFGPCSDFPLLTVLVCKTD